MQGIILIKKSVEIYIFIQYMGLLGESMISKYDETKAFDYENGFYLTSGISRMSNILSHYELYKRIVELPGDIVELGVYKGGSLFQFAAFREILENEKARKLIGFDVFDEFPAAHNAGDKVFREKWITETRGDFLTKDEIQRSLSYRNIGNTELIQGNIEETIPVYLEEHPYMKIALLHIDVDIYEPTVTGLTYLYDRVVRGGIIVLDDYGVAGETEAVDEFIKGKDINIKRLSISQHKPSYIQKMEN